MNSLGASLLLAAALSTTALAAPILNPDNGHYYEAVTHSSGIIWDDANAEANVLGSRPVGPIAR